MVERRVIAVEGIVQGVGFRPYVHRLAAANALSGFVRNDADGVLIDVEGDASSVDEFCRLLTVTPPALATIARVQIAPAAPRAYDGFRIASSDGAGADRTAAAIPADAATCDACVAELFDPRDRRFGHAFITCTECGPRFTVVQRTPYDRERTTMAAFPLCVRCRREYEDPHDRRFHAESIACPECGPVLSVVRDARTLPLGSGPALDAAAAAVRAGEIVAIKALGGFHLACDASSTEAVQRLRARKQRPAKPFAVMVRDLAAAERLCTLSAAERVVLASSARPVVLLQRRPDTRITSFIAPNSRTLGVMLPTTPLHHLLLAAVDRPLVMTSGNRSGDPVVTDDSSSLSELAGIADLFLTHDRPIAARCDDSVVRIISGEAFQLRRSRGHVPHAIPMPFAAPAPVLALGGHLKNTVCLLNGTSAHLSAHVGDLESQAARIALARAIDDTIRIAGAMPAVVAHDLHPDYASTRVALAFAAEHGIEQRVPVQHHHAHVAACVAERGLQTPVIGVVFDGAGLGTDGAIWGGEFLVVDGARFVRHGHLAYVPLPGGDAAARRPWRSAVAHVAGLDVGEQVLAGMRPAAVGADEWRLVQHSVTHAEHTPRTSSVGRLFDAVASLLDLCHVASFEGEAAMALEAAADRHVVSRYPVAISDGGVWTADPSLIIAGVLDDLACGRDRAGIAAAFHGALRDLIVLGCERVRESTGICDIVLSGGVFMNAMLTESTCDALAARAFDVLLPRLAPCNDGGLALGQAHVAACALREEPCA